MKKTSLKRWSNVILTASILCAIVNPQTVQAARNSGPSAIINSSEAIGDVLIRGGTTFVTLTDLNSLGVQNFRYDPAKRQITVQDNGKKVILTPDSKTILIHGSAKTLTAAPFINKGKTMIPLRAVSEAFGAKVFWNASAKTAYIARTDAKTAADLKSDKLSTARNAALKLPRISLIPSPLLERTYLEMQGTDYYFPAGKADRYFEVDNDLVSYYSIHNGLAKLGWQAKIDPDKGKNDKAHIFFLPLHMVKEIGKQPEVKSWTVAQFKFRYPVGTTYYSLLNLKGEIASGNVELDNKAPSYEGVIVDIPEEAPVGR